MPHPFKKCSTRILQKYWKTFLRDLVTLKIFELWLLIFITSGNHVTAATTTPLRQQSNLETGTELINEYLHQFMVLNHLDYNTSIRILFKDYLEKYGGVQQVHLSTGRMNLTVEPTTNYNQTGGNTNPVFVIKIFDESNDTKNTTDNRKQLKIRRGKRLLGGDRNKTKVGRDKSKYRHSTKVLIEKPTDSLELPENLQYSAQFSPTSRSRLPADSFQFTDPETEGTYKGRQRNLELTDSYPRQKSKISRILLPPKEADAQARNGVLATSNRGSQKFRQTSPVNSVNRKSFDQSNLDEFSAAELPSNQAESEAIQSLDEQNETQFPVGENRESTASLQDTIDYRQNDYQKNISEPFARSEVLNLPSQTQGPPEILSGTETLNEVSGSLLEATIAPGIRMDQLMSQEIAKTGMKIKKVLDNVNFTFDSTVEEDKRQGRPRHQFRLSQAESSYYGSKEPASLIGTTISPTFDVIPGVAGIDYPIHARPPVSIFSCKKSPQNSHVFYADINSGCQVFYVCYGGGFGEAMLCPNGTLFNQEHLVCDWWYNVQCDS